jgi:hypothetical protein
MLVHDSSQKDCPAKCQHYFIMSHDLLSTVLLYWIFVDFPVPLAGISKAESPKKMAESFRAEINSLRKGTT